jgi:hypothetical protein
MTDDLTIPDFLNRKLNPQTQATLEERKAYCNGATVFVEVQKFSTITPEDEAVLEAMEQEKKLKTKLRIDKMLAKKRAKDQTRGIPDEFLSWDAKNLRYYDVRVRAHQKLVAAFKRHGLKTPPADFYPRIRPYPWDERKADVMKRAA